MQLHREKYCRNEREITLLVLKQLKDFKRVHRSEHLKKYKRKMVHHRNITGEVTDYFFDTKSMREGIEKKKQQIL